MEPIKTVLYLVTEMADFGCLHMQDVDLYHERTRYFGVSEILETTRSGSSLPLMRYDSSFESMASTLEERFCTHEQHS